MSHQTLFQPSEYRELSGAERRLLEHAYEKATEALHRTITSSGFAACSIGHLHHADDSDGEDYRSVGTDRNYRSVWGRDGAMTTIWTLDLIGDETVQAAQARTLRTLFGHQSVAGQIPTNVRLDGPVPSPEYSGVGGIASIDSVLWALIASTRYAEATGDWSIVEEYADQHERAMRWVAAHDSNNCGLLEIPEAGDWTDLFGRSYHVLYDEVLWYRALVSYAQLLRHFEDHERADSFQAWANRVRDVLLRTFWPSTSGEEPRSFADKQYSLGDARYLVAEVSPFSFSWRCDIYGNLLAYLTNVLDTQRAKMTLRFLWGVGANDPWPVKNLYPPVTAGDPEWREYFTVNLMNLPNHYHNGGIWPFLGGLWVRFIHKLGMQDLARRELVKLAHLCSLGMDHEWEFNEWHHGVTGRAMGKAYQAWSAASFLQACHTLHLEPEWTPHRI